MPNLDLRPGLLPITVYYKGDVSFRFYFTSGGNVYPLTDVTGADFIIYEKNGTPALSLASGSGLTINSAGGYIDMAVTNAQIVALYSQEYDYEFRLTLTGGTVWPILDSYFTVSENGQASVTDSDISISLDGTNVDVAVISPATSSGGGTWGGITGTLSDQTDLQTALDGKVDENAAITGATKTKITYDAKGLVTAGADAAISDITGLQTALDGKADSAHTHPLSDITQSGATLNQIPKWNGSAWVPADDETGGGAGITEYEYVEMQTAIADGDLTPGAFYRITDAAGTDLGFICQAVTTNEITVNGTGGYLNADFQAVGDYANTPQTFGTQLGIWRTGFEQIEIATSNLTPDSVAYSTSSGALDDAEAFTTDLGTTGTIIHDDGAGTVTIQFPSQPLVAGEVITGDNSGNTVTVDTYTNPVFSAGDTITGGTTGATAYIVSFDENVGSIIAYMTSPGVAFDGSEVLDNGNGVTADMDGAAGSPTIVLGDVVIWNLLHYQLTDATLLDGNNPADNTDAYTLLDKATYPETYVTAWDVSQWSFVNNRVDYRNDGQGNVIYGENGVLYHRWGDNRCQSNVIYGGYIDGLNYSGSYNKNTIYADAAIYDIEGQSSSYIDNCFLFSNSEITEITLGDNSFLGNNIIKNGASLAGITAGANCSISGQKIESNAVFGGDTILEDGAQVNNNAILNGITVSNKTFAAGAEFSGNTIGVDMTEAETISDNIVGKRSIPGFSDIPGTIDITGLTALDLTAAWAQYRGIYNLTSSNASETISADSLSNFPTLFPFRLVPASGLVLTLTCTAAASAVAGSIVGSTTTIVLDGTNGDFVELEADSTGTFVRVKNLQVYS